jgi:5-methylcytosine-specific restriction endonuclease McrA
MALGVVDIETAITKIASTYKDGTPKARIIDNDFKIFDWEDWIKIQTKDNEKTIRSVNFVFKVPEVIQFTRYDRIPKKQINYNRKNIFTRDKHQCQYCMSKQNLTLDHILPKSRNGNSSWENVVVACVKCNLKKGNRTPQEAGMQLLTKPIKPKSIITACEESWKNWV